MLIGKGSLLTSAPLFLAFSFLLTSTSFSKVWYKLLSFIPPTTTLPEALTVALVNVNHIKSKAWYIESVALTSTGSKIVILSPTPNLYIKSFLDLPPSERFKAYWK